MAEMTTKRYPVRGALYGLILGLAVWYFLQFQFASFGFDSVGGVVTRAVIVIVAGILVGVIWAYVAPARKPKGAAPAAAAAPVEAVPPVEAAAPAPAPEAAEAPAPLEGGGTPSLPDDDE